MGGGGGHLVLSWLQGLCAISCTGQTVTCCHGSVPNLIHFHYLTAAVIKCIVQCIDRTFCYVVTTHWRSEPCGWCLTDLAALIDALWVHRNSVLRSCHSQLTPSKPWFCRCTFCSITELVWYQAGCYHGSWRPTSFLTTLSCADWILAPLVNLL